MAGRGYAGAARRYVGRACAKAVQRDRSCLDRAGRDGPRRRGGVALMEFISGENFSGRSATLMESLRARWPAFFIGPYAEAALSGLSGTVADEVDIYRMPSSGRPAFAPLDLAVYAARKPPTLSGGEQVLLALQCFAQSDYALIGIDTALEQLDPGNRNAALAYLSQGVANGFDAALVDNTLACPAGWTERGCIGQAPALTC